MADTSDRTTVHAPRPFATSVTIHLWQMTPVDFCACGATPEAARAAMVAELQALDSPAPEAEADGGYPVAVAVGRAHAARHVRAAGFVGGEAALSALGLD
jgi:hypothetical protein